MCHWALTSVHSLAHTCISHGPARGQTQLQASQTPLPIHVHKTHTGLQFLATSDRCGSCQTKARHYQEGICGGIQATSLHSSPNSSFWKKRRRKTRPLATFLQNEITLRFLRQAKCPVYVPKSTFGFIWSRWMWIWQRLLHWLLYVSWQFRY